MEQFWCEVWNIGEFYYFILGKGVVDLNGVVVVQVEDIVWICFFNV